MRVGVVGGLLLALAALGSGSLPVAAATTWLPPDEVLIGDVSGAPGTPVRLAEVGPDGTAAVVFVDEDAVPRYDVHHPWPDLGWDSPRAFRPALPAGHTLFGGPSGLGVLPDGTVVMAFGATEDASGDQHTWVVEVSPDGTMRVPARVDGTERLMPHYAGNAIRANGAGVLAVVMYDQLTGRSYVAFRTSVGWHPVRALEPASYDGTTLLPQQFLMRPDGSLLVLAADPGVGAWTTWTAAPSGTGPVASAAPVHEKDLAFAAVAANGALMRGYVDSTGSLPQHQAAWWTYQARPGGPLVKKDGWFNQLADVPRDLSTGILAVHVPTDATQPPRLVRNGKLVDARLEDIARIQEFPTTDGVADLVAFHDGAIRADLTGELPRITLAESASSMFGAVNSDGVGVLTYQHPTSHAFVARGGGIGTRRTLARTPTFWQLRQAVAVSWERSNAWARPGRDKILRSQYRPTRSDPVKRDLFRDPKHSTTARLPLGKPGITRCYRLAGKDSADVVSETRVCLARPADESILTKGSGWRRVEHASYWRGSALRARAAGSRLTYRTSHATSLALVARTCPRCGRVRVKWGSLRRMLDLSSAEDRRRVVIDLAARGKGRSKRLTITVVSSGRPVYVDGLGVSTVVR